MATAHLPPFSDYVSDEDKIIWDSLEPPREDTGVGFNRQVGGDHYKRLGLQPLEATYLRYGYKGLKAAIHTKVDKYLGREKDNEVQDIEKAIHCLEILLEKAREQGV